MNSNKLPSLRRLFSIAFLAVAAMMLSGLAAKATPYASGVTNDNGTIRFYLNESADSVTVVYDDGTTNANFDPVNAATGLNQSTGQKSFALGLHDGYKIIVQKTGTGVPTQISTDYGVTNGAPQYTGWGTPRGLDVNKNPANGPNFGTVYVGHDANQANGSRNWGIYALSGDLSALLAEGGVTTNLFGNGQLVGPFVGDDLGAQSTSMPNRLRVGDDGYVYVCGAATASATVWAFSPRFETTNLVLFPRGENQGITAGTHGDPYGVFSTGSLSSNNLVLYTWDAGLSAPDTNAPPFPTLSIGGPLGVNGYGPTVNGDYNDVFRYNIGSGDAITHYTLANVYTNGTGGSGGTGYHIGDQLTLVGGTCAASNSVNFGHTNAVVQVVTTNGAGAVIRMSIVSPGDYLVPPAGPIATTGGFAGSSGATLNAWFPQVIWSGKPNFAACVGDNGLFDLLSGDVCVGTDGKIFAMQTRQNLDMGNLQVFDQALPGTPRVYDSIRFQQNGTLVENWNYLANSDTPSHIALSPDGKYIATMNINNEILIELLTNGVPDDASLFVITNTPNTGNGRGFAWDAADNLYAVSSGQFLLRSFSLGNTSTCITSNDSSGLAGKFQLSLPSVATTVSVPNPNASQNYINSTPAGTPLPGTIRISLNKATLAAPVTVGFSLSGTAVQGTHYTLNTGTDASNIVTTTSSVTFPAGTFPFVGNNWFKDITVTPTALPLYTNTLTASLTLSTSASYLRNAPVVGTVFIKNTGPNVILLTPALTGTTMYRGVSNDYAMFVLTRLGDTNGPGNSAAGVTPRNLTITNVNYGGTAISPTNGAVNPDYLAGSQPLSLVNPPVAGSANVVIQPGQTIVTNIIGKPVYHLDVTAQPVDVSVLITLTNPVPVLGDNTNLTDLEGDAYRVVAGNAATLSILDNRVGHEVVLYSNPLTNAADSVNWTLTFAATNMNTASPLSTNVAPYTQANYANSTPFDGVHDYTVDFGFDPTTDINRGQGIVQPSPLMTASNWNRVLRMTVNKNNTVSPAGVNLFPHQSFGGNYALRFNMFFSLNADAVGSPFNGTFPRENAMFGVDHFGTNCDWRIAIPINNRAGNNGNDRTNQDGVWYTVDAGQNAQTPADFDAFQGAPIPNAGWPIPDTDSSTAFAKRGVFKAPPFDSANSYAFNPNNVGGSPVDQWVDVSVEITKQTNATMLINKSQIFKDQITNAALGNKVMLGYLDADRNNADPYSAFVYYSNVRVVELSPYISLYAQTTTGTNRVIVAQGSSLTFTSSASFASAPITNTWYVGTTNTTVPGNPKVALQTNTVNATTMNDIYTQTFTTNTDGTNYMNVFSDAAGSVTSSWVAVEFVATPANLTVKTGAAKTNLTVTFAGPTAPTVFQWYYNASGPTFAGSTKLVANTHYGTPTAAALWITNITTADAGWYFAAATNAVGGVVTLPAVLTVQVPPTGLAVTPSPQNDLWGSNATFTVSTTGGDLPFTYVWKKGATVLTDDGIHIGGSTSSQLTISNITAGDAGTYTAAVTNAAGGATANGILVEVTPAPRILSVSAPGGTVTVSFTTTNSFDTTSTFTLQAEGDLSANNWTNVPGSYTSSGGGNFQVTAPQDPSAPQLFYRVIHN